LVELLVVIGIIALLISILLPALGKARQSAQTISCAANLHTIGQMCAIYQANNRGYLPPLSQTATNSSGAPSFDNNYFRGYNIWSLLGFKAGSRTIQCPVVMGQYALPVWSASNNLVRNWYTYNWNWLLAGAETNPIVAPNVPHAQTMENDPTTIYGLTYRSVPNATNTLLVADSATVVAYQTDDQPGTDRGMEHSTLKPGSYTTVSGGDGSPHQFIRGLCPVHGAVTQSKGVMYPVLSDGMLALQGQINVCYADFSVRTVTIKQGQILNTADSSWATPVLNDSTGNGSGHSGNQCMIPGTRLDPTVTP
jgi:type II secretory pathway pseudopilin PulG